MSASGGWVVGQLRGPEAGSGRRDLDGVMGGWLELADAVRLVRRASRGLVGVARADLVVTL